LPDAAQLQRWVPGARALATYEKLEHCEPITPLDPDHFMPTIEAAVQAFKAQPPLRS